MRPPAMAEGFQPGIVLDSGGGGGGGAILRWRGV
jgi:hypothetical protein